MEIYVIQTPNDKKRENSFNLEIFDQSFDGRDIKHYEAIMDKNMPRRGISKSHRAIVQIAKDQGREEVCVLEDDIKFLTPHSLERFLNIHKLIPKDYSMYMIGLYDGIIEKEFGGYAKVSGRISGLHGYIISSKFYDAFLSADENLNLDFYISEYLKPTIYCMYPFGAIQFDGFSYNTKQIMNYNYNLYKKYKLLGNE